MIDDRQDTFGPGGTGEGGTGSGPCEEQQALTALSDTEDLATRLMEQVCHSTNLNQAYKHVKANKGSPGVDGMTVNDMKDWLANHKESFIQSLLEGSYCPQPVRAVEIPKPGQPGKTRQLGIPCVIDRLVQQAIHQILDPIFDPTFSTSSYGFRRGRKAHDAIQQASRYVRDGHVYVVDIDLEQFFDRVNHDILMSRLAHKIKDKRLLKIIRRFLNAGVMQNGVCTERYEGAPQGGPLSPLLSNILLDEVDKELERRGHKFCRYADDLQIYVRSQRAGERVYQTMKRFFEKRLKLKVNDDKSAVALTRQRQFLGYRIQTNGRLSMAPKAFRRAKDKVRWLTRRNRGVSFELVIRQLNQYLRGWFNYYKLVESKTLWRDLDSWIRRKLRCYKLKQKKRGKSISQYLKSLGLRDQEARQIASSGKGWWRLSRTGELHRTLDIKWFRGQKLISLYDQWVQTGC